MLFCDMHIHSNCSDGSCSPEELISIAEASGIKAIALCDHNTISGVERFVQSASSSSVIAVPGVEVTTGYNGHELHILGLFLKKESHTTLTEYLSQINQRKETNNRELAQRLINGGFDIDYEEIKCNAGDAIPNRVHFAKALLNKGYVSSISEAFDTVLAEGSGYFFPAEKLNSIDVIGFLSSIGAVPVLAHPFLELSTEELHEFLPKAKKCGLMAIEAIYPLFSKEESETAINAAKEFNILISGGSDFHGTNKPDIKMGVGKNNISIPFSIYEELKKASVAINNKKTEEAM